MFNSGLRLWLQATTYHNFQSCYMLLQVVVQQLKQLFPHTQPYVHPILGSAVIMPGTGPLQPDYHLCGKNFPVQCSQALYLPVQDCEVLPNACWLIQQQPCGMYIGCTA